jgi:preprotein translocase subunit SecE
MLKVTVTEFIQQVRQEVGKIVWPTRKDAITSTIVVFVMVSITAVFFLGVDIAVHKIIQMILNWGVNK